MRPQRIVYEHKSALAAEWIRQNQLANWRDCYSGGRLYRTSEERAILLPKVLSETGTDARTVACGAFELVDLSRTAKPNISSAVSFRIPSRVPGLRSSYTFRSPPPPSPAGESYERVIVLRDLVGETTIAAGRRAEGGRLPSHSDH